MKRTIFILLVMIPAIHASVLPFQRGVNLTTWFQKESAQQIQFTQYTEQDFINIKSLGCDVIRLPINLHSMTNGTPNYTIDSLFYYFLDQVVVMAENQGMQLILDNHTFDPSTNTNPNIGDILIPVWTQLADHYKNHSNLIYYEILNEPHGIADTTWNRIQQQIINAIRSVDQTHTIIVGPAGWNSYHNLQYMPQYTDNNLIYTFHFYDPFVFTHQGASWVTPSMEPLAGVPFPYDPALMPPCPPGLIGTWIETSLNNYPNDGTVEHVHNLIDIAVAFKNSRNVPVFCGEFGVYIPNSNNNDRVYWYEVVRDYLDQNGISWTIWDYHGGFGLFEAGTSGFFDYDVNIPLVNALGLNPPQQYVFVLEPDTCGFDMYMDYIGPNIVEASWVANGTVSYYSTNGPVQGNHCIYWTGTDQYGYIGFNFRPIKDLSQLVNDGYAIDFWVRGDSPGAQFDIRFVDTKIDTGDHPWRMGITIDDSVAAWDGTWQHIQIPLNVLIELGSWDNGWFEPQGNFDWAASEYFQIVAEHHNLQGINFWFDKIQIMDPAQVYIHTDEIVTRDFRLYQNYPNPFNPKTTIEFSIPNTEFITLKIYNLLGEEVTTLVSKELNSGNYKVEWYASGFSSGLYFYRLEAEKGFVQSKKLILLK
jgi:endoglucanase